MFLDHLLSSVAAMIDERVHTVNVFFGACGTPIPIDRPVVVRDLRSDAALKAICAVREVDFNKLRLW
jgi:hypothetical protein